MTIQEILIKNIKHRPIFKKLSKIINEDEILLIMGARQIGKTHSLFWLIQFLVNQKKINQKQILYLDLESSLVSEYDLQLGLIAKSIKNKNKLTQEGFMAFDLRDF